MGGLKLINENASTIAPTVSALSDHCGHLVLSVRGANIQIGVLNHATARGTLGIDRWELMFPDELEAAVAEFPIVYMPYGLCEPHGPQNALGCDALRPAGAMRTAAEEYGGIVMPAVYWHCHEAGTSAVWGHRTIGNTRTWLTSVPPWMFFKNMSYHIRAVDTLGFHGAVIFSGHAGSPQLRTFRYFLEIMQRHVATRLHCHMPIGMGTEGVAFRGRRGHWRPRRPRRNVAAVGGDARRSGPLPLAADRCARSALCHGR